MNLVSLLPAQAQERPHQAAIIRTRDHRDASITFAQLDEASARGAAFLRTLGIQPADRVLLLIPMSIDLYVVLLAVLRLGAVVTLLDPAAGRAHIDHCCELARPRAQVHTSKAQVLRFISPGLRSIPLKITIGRRWLPGVPWDHRTAPPAAVEDVPASHPALLTFTSGSTGQPKAAVRSHGLLLAQNTAVAAALRPEPGATDLTTLAVFALSNLAQGVTSLIPDADLRAPGAIDPVPIVAQMHRHPTQSVVASPAFMWRLVEHGRAHRRTLPELRRVFTGGAPVFWHTLDALQELAPNARVTALYGSTEAEPIAHTSLAELSSEDRDRTRRGGGLPAGPPVPHTQVSIVTDQWGQPLTAMTSAEFQQRRLPPEQVGEIVVSGHHVLPGYLNGQFDQETKFRVDGAPWHRTGDAGYLDNQGRLWLVGRCAARTIDAHGTIYPLQVEAAAHATAPIKRCAFLSWQGRRLLVIESQESLPPAVRASIKAELAWAQVADFVHLDQIPVDRRHNAKIDYPALHRALARVGA